jgi:hypothetical protein
VRRDATRHDTTETLYVIEVMNFGCDPRCCWLTTDQVKFGVVEKRAAEAHQEFLLDLLEKRSDNPHERPSIRFWYKVEAR